MTNHPPGWRSFDVRVWIMSHGTGDWELEIRTASYPDKVLRDIPIASGKAGEPLPKQVWLHTLETIGYLLDAAIRELIEPM